jgi:hypothetical protein
MFLVQKKPCTTCIYRPGNPVGIAKLEAEIADPHMAGFFRGYRVCHHSKGEVCCAGFWARHKNDFGLGQIAQRLQAGRFVMVDVRAKKGTIHGSI